jgi:hypothetical protein
VLALESEDRRLVAPPIEGAANVGASLRADDARLRVLARVLEARARRGAIAEDEADAVAARIALLDRTFASGRGMDDTFSWLSALTAKDLVEVISDRLGPGLEPVGDGVYELTETSNNNSAAGIGLAVGAYGTPGVTAGLAGVTGVTSETMTRVTVTESRGATRFAVQANVLDEWTALAYSGRAGVFDALMGDVFAYELTGTLLRLLFGDEGTLLDLVERSRDEVAKAAAELDGDADVSVFWPAG